MSHHSEDYKETAVKHYLEGKDDILIYFYSKSRFTFTGCLD